MNSKYLLMVLALGALTFQACSDDDDDGEQNKFPGNEQVEKSFLDKFPGATQMEWERKAGYYVVDFMYNVKDMEAWFESNGTWKMSQTAMMFNDLPQAVRATFDASEYKSWYIEEVDLLERPGMELLYVIEAEKGSSEMALFYTADGTLVKAIPDKSGDYTGFLPPVVSENIMGFIEKNYPQATLVEVETETEQGATLIEVEIRQAGFLKSLYFTTSEQWLRTEWDVNPTTLPSVVTAAVQNSIYASWRIDDAEYVETPQGDYYLLEMEQGDQDALLKISPAGEILS